MVLRASNHWSSEYGNTTAYITWGMSGEVASIGGINARFQESFCNHSR